MSTRLRRRPIARRATASEGSHACPRRPGSPATGVACKNWPPARTSAATSTPSSPRGSSRRRTASRAAASCRSWPPRRRWRASPAAAGPRRRSSPSRSAPPARRPARPSTTPRRWNSAASPCRCWRPAYDGRPDQDRRQPGPPRQPRRRLGHRAGERPGPVRRGPQPHRRAARRRPRDRRHLGRLREGRRHHHGRRRPRPGILAEPSLSPSRRRLQDELQQALPQLRWFEHDPIDDRDARDGAARAFGRPVPRRALARAREGDRRLRREPAAGPPAGPAQRADVRARPSSRGREDEPALRVRAGGRRRPASSPTTGSRSPAADVPFALALLAGELFVNQHLPVPAGAGFTAADLGPWAAQTADRTRRCAPSRRISSRTAAPAWSPSARRQPAGAHHLVARDQRRAGQRRAPPSPTSRCPPPAPGLADLTGGAAAAGQVETLVILGGNPVATAPADVDFAAALGRARTSIHLSEHQDATGRLCTWHLPRTHYLEAWGDAAGRRRQPGRGAAAHRAAVRRPQRPRTAGAVAGQPGPEGPRRGPRQLPPARRRRSARRRATIPASRSAGAPSCTTVSCRPPAAGETPALAATAGLDAPRGQATLSPETPRADHQGRHLPARRPLRRQRLAPGTAGLRHQAVVGQRREP